MSTKGIESVVSRAMSDDGFIESLLADPDQALADFDLTAEEIARFKSMSRIEITTLTDPEEGKSFAIMIGEMKSHRKIHDDTQILSGMADT